MIVDDEVKDAVHKVLHALDGAKIDDPVLLLYGVAGAAGALSFSLLASAPKDKQKEVKQSFVLIFNNLASVIRNVKL